MNASKAKQELKRYANSKKANFLKGFFKTGKGQYAEGDKLIGVVVPDTRKVAKLFNDLPLNEIQVLLKSRIHEERLLALIILVDKFKLAAAADKKKIYNFYLKNTAYINNWDLVDLSAHYIAGAYLHGKQKKILYKLAKSKHLWERRIAIVSTFEFIKQDEYQDILKIAELLLKDEQDLIHKAVGWMLREVGKRIDRSVLLKFLDKHAGEMPRTMLRYSIEHLSPKMRKHYLSLRRR